MAKYKITLTVEENNPEEYIEGVSQIKELRNDIETVVSNYNCMRQIGAVKIQKTNEKQGVLNSSWKDFMNEMLFTHFYDRNISEEDLWSFRNTERIESMIEEIIIYYNANKLYTAYDEMWIGPMMHFLIYLEDKYLGLVKSLDVVINDLAVLYDAKFLIKCWDEINKE